MDPKTAKLVGSGSYGAVQLVMRHATGELLAYKRFRKKEPLAEARELCALREFSDFNHPNLLMLHAAVVDANQKWIHGILTPLCDLSLETYWRQRMGIIAPAFVHTCVSQIIQGLAYLHSLRLVHRDIKPGNTLLKLMGSGAWLVKLGDFGTARRLAMDGMTTGVGTPGWAPPEDQVGMAAGTAGDVWSAGVMLREMAIGSRAWEAGNAVGGRLAHIVGVMEPPPPNYAEVLPAPLHVYAGAYLAAVAERGGTLDTWEVYNRRRAPPVPLHRATARMMLQLAPDARKTASELMASEFVRQSRRGRKREWVKVCPQTKVPRDGGASCVPPHAAAATTTDAPHASALPGGPPLPSGTGLRQGGSEPQAGVPARIPGSSRQVSLLGSPRVRCTCSGACDNKHSQHLCTRQGRRQCKNMLAIGQDSTVCSQCRCRQCGKGRWKSGHCYAHALHETGEVLPLVHKFTDVLGHWLPMDLHALMQSGVRDPAGFYMQAMLWEPWAVEAFGDEWEATTASRDSRAQRLRRAGPRPSGRAPE